MNHNNLDSIYSKGRISVAAHVTWRIRVVYRETFRQVRGVEQISLVERYKLFLCLFCLTDKTYKNYKHMLVEDYLHVLTCINRLLFRTWVRWLSACRGLAFSPNTVHKWSTPSLVNDALDLRTRFSFDSKCALQFASDVVINKQGRLRIRSLKK